MHLEGPNPTQVQVRPLKDRKEGSLPLILIHDGGGTTFGFWMLDSLRRDIWAVHNPNFFSGEPWEGGMDEMARHYIGLLRDAGISGAILLGGWSLGGYLSIAMARMLAEKGADVNITVTGLLLIDSPNHVPRIDDHPEPLMVNIPPLVQKAFDYCHVMLRSWSLPAWDGPACAGEDVLVTAGGKHVRLSHGTILHKSVSGDWTTITRPMHPPAETRTAATANHCLPPPAVLIRCTRRAKIACNQSDKPCLVDEFRDDRLLGWERQGYPSFIQAVLDVDSDHYGIFDRYDRKQMRHVTSQVESALEILENLEVAKMAS